MKSLDSLRIGLRGLSLIEASAGTGKTYTISTLYLRALLERGLEVDQILVVTFTKAATEELRDRIRRRVAQALQWLQGDIDAARREEDSVLADLLLSLQDRALAVTRLSDALTRMDEAAVYTIHGFCQRMIQDSAFESGAAFDVEFITDESRLRATAAADFWRSRVVRAGPDKARWIRALWKTPDALMGELHAALALDDLRILPPVDDDAIAKHRQELDQVFSQLQETWRRESGAIRVLLETSPAVKRSSYNKTVVPKVLAVAEQVATDDALPSSFPEGFERLTPTFLAERGTKPGETPPSHPFFDLCGRLERLVSQSASNDHALFLSSARTYVRDAMARRKRDESLLYFDDLLRQLDQALAGEAGDTLAATVRQRFPMALIDEFQDTDPQQYRIFRRVYAGQPECALFLIGDPKQAIYAFRGADIFTYMEAREDSDREGEQYTLGVNWRSGSGLIQGLNTLFSRALKPFIFEPYIEYQEVAPASGADDEPLLLAGEAPLPLQFWMLEVNEDNQTKRPPGSILVQSARDAAARACAEYIAGLLNLADAGQATLGERAVLPKDIALLVRTHREGDQVQEALRACGVSSVTLSQASVFEGEDAEELAMVLGALAELNDEGRLRAALATGLLGRSATELERLAQDEVAWEAVLARFQRYRDRWLEWDFMVAVQEMIAAEGIPERLLQRPDGERRLTNLIQLVELLQVAAREHPGVDGLLRWFADQRAGDERDEARQLRLESDEGLVKVVTMHKSKGLEYPLVFIPFPWSYFNPRKRPPPFFHDDKGAACLDLGSDDQGGHRKRERVEQLAERLRLFYVSVTRAAKLCVLCWGKVHGAHESALAYLLHRDPDAEILASRMRQRSEAEIRADLDALAAEAPACISVIDLPAATGKRWGGAAVARDRLSARAFSGPIDSGWRVSSYSGLVRGGESEQPDYDAVVGTDAPDEEPDAAPGDRVFDLPAGTHAGHFLHEVFEHLDFPQASGETLEATVRGLLERYGQLRTGRSGGHDWTGVVTGLVTDVLDTPLDDASGLRLRDIGCSDRLAELEFHFPVSGLDAGGLRDLLASTPNYTASGQGLGFEPLRGLMRGFIDLVFRADGRYFIVDYKSNLLGKRLPAYAQTGLQQAIRQHRYDLQYLIYTLALHRFLARRLPGYQYEQHFGGVYYLFLRGMRPSQGPRFGVWHDRPEHRLVERMERLFCGGEETV